ncbi:16117_t:CDS:2, partial [Acaulospora colombiana]
FFRLRGVECSWLNEGSAWLLTSPSYLGYEGINPLNVHNTFGERHVYVLQTGVDEDASKPEQSGYYVCSISGSTHPAMVPLESRVLPTIRLNLLTADRKLKLTAISRAVQSDSSTETKMLPSRNPTQQINSTGLGVAWQKESSLDRKARRRVDSFLHQKAEEIG